MIYNRNSEYLRINNFEPKNDDTYFLIREDVKNSECVICSELINEKIQRGRLSFYGHVHQDQATELLNPHLICQDCSPRVETEARKHPNSVFAKCISCNVTPPHDWRKEYTLDIESQSFIESPAPFSLRRVSTVEQYPNYRRKCLAFTLAGLGMGAYCLLLYTCLNGNQPDKCSASYM